MGGSCLGMSRDICIYAFNFFLCVYNVTAMITKGVGVHKLLQNNSVYSYS